MTPFDARRCELGEGALWHPLRQTLYWFDILGRRMLWRGADSYGEWAFSEHVSAAGWVDRDTLLIASESALWRFDIPTGGRSLITPLEGDRPETRSNDGRADPWGGFWIGTMGKAAQAGAGAIYRLYKGELRRLHAAVTIPNAICFAPDRSMAYFADTARQTIFRQRLDAEGWPAAEAETFLNLTAEGLYPDGAVTDAEGAIWNAQWGAGRVARYLPDGTFDRAIALPAPHVTCPAFAGGDLLITSARQDLTPAQLAAAPLSGQTFRLQGVPHGREEPAVRLA